ncbi:hypothetical protein SAMN05216223_11490 [Actinacidiphila yanglinensis]|uniref:Uncharacterized protein n=1 Tax=Actinacidiphila yanglinensis TaxID=310779 RepID=A0A1H6DFL5_9ACTN|nr:hypothetical protein [Actinacidiphila yanglinensis]SEG83495.1 hypothetical protein SAMN05216223_11490 [Actinacidiphila yanglinensis]
MRSPKSAATVLAATVALVLGCGLGTAAASPAHPARAAASPRAAAAACSSAASAASGGAVHGSLSPAEVKSRLSTLTAQRRAQYGIAAKGPLGTAGVNPALRPLTDIHPSQGTAFLSQSGADGSCATQSVSTRFTVHNGDTTIYTPTMYPPGGSCVELVTVYTTSGRSVSAWDWCGSVSFAASVTVDSSFLATYTNGSGAYTGRVIKTDSATNTWAAALYDYATGRWDTLFTQSGTNQSGRTDGWDIEELYSSVGTSGQAHSCDDMAGLTFESSGISVRKSGVWSAASSANSDSHYDTGNSSFSCPGRSFQMVSAYDHWKDVG